MNRTELEELLRARILAAPGERVNESGIAEHLGVSRTPVREALLRLEGGGLVRFERGRGFVAVALSAEEVRETYPIIAQLEELAVRGTGSALRGLVGELTAINAAFAAATDPTTAHELDAEFHRALVSRCGNRKLLDLLAGLWQTIRRYEHVYFADPHHRHGSAAQHAAIINAASTGDAPTAATVTAENTTESLHRLLRHL